MTEGAALVEGRAWLARLRNGPDGEICGAGFVVDAAHVLTCAHVAVAAGASGPGDRVFVDFPLLGAGCWAEVLAEGWAPAPKAATTGDTALLRLTEAPDQVLPVPLRSLRSVDGHAFSCYGFPEGHDDGVPTEGHLGKAVGRDWVKLEVASALVVQPGFSGAALWSERLGAVVAMIVTRDLPTGGRVAFAVPVRVLAGRSPLVAWTLPTPLDLDPDRRTHWGPRSRGVASDAEHAGWLFTGRRRVLGELVSWLRSGGPPSLRVVTGTPGCGKSAIVARLVTAADRHYRRRIPDLGDDPASVPPADVVDVTFHAKGRTVADLVAHMAAVLDLEADGPERLLAALDEAQRWPTVVIDALDESIEPRGVARLLVDLTDRGARVLVGTRDHLLDELSDPDPLHADQPPYLDVADVEAYVRGLLDAQPPPQAVSDAEVHDLVEAAEGNFLVAGLVARALTLGARHEGPFPRGVNRAFDRYLDALPDPKTARDLLLPLAYGFGDGLPAGPLWLAAVAALRRPCTPADLEDLLASPAGSFLVTRLDGAGGNRHRLFHLALAETLTAKRDRRRDQEAIWRAWTAALPTGPAGEPSWLEAPPYLCEHGADHATEAGLLDELAGHPGYLLVGDLDRLLVHLGQDPAGPLAEERAALRLAAHRARALDTTRRGAVLALAARHLGLGALADALVSISRPEFVPRWAHRLGDPNQPLTGHVGGVNAVVVGQLGGRDLVISGGEDGTVRFWDPASSQPVGQPLTGHRGRVNSAAVGRVDGRDLVVSGGDDGTVRLWDPATGQAVGQPLTGDGGRVRSVALGEAGGRAVVVSGSHDGTIRLWDPTSGQLVGEPLTGHKRPVYSVAVGRMEGRDVVVSGGDDGTVRLWDPAGGAPLGEPLTGHRGRVSSVALGQVGGRDVLVSGGDDGAVRLWDPAHGQLLGQPLRGHDRWVRSVGIGQVGGRNVVVSAGLDGTVRLWDPSDARPLGQFLTGHGRWVRSVALGRLGGRDIVVSGGDDGSVRLWDPNRAEPLGQPLPGHERWVYSVAVGQVGGREVVISGGDDRTVRMWHPATGQALGPPLTGHRDWVTSVAVGQVGDRDVVVSGGYDRTVRLWDGLTGQPLGEPLTGHDYWVGSVALGRAGGRDVVVSGGEDGTVRLWDPVSGQALGPPLTGHTRWVHSVAVGQVDGQDVVVSGGEDRTIRVWDAANGRPLRPPLTGHRRRVRAVLLAQIGGRDVIVSAGDDGTVRLWDPSSGEPLGEPLTGHQARIRSVALGQVAGRDVIVSGADDSTVRLWDAHHPHSGELRCIDLLAGVSAVATGGEGRIFVASGAAVCAFAPGFPTARRGHGPQPGVGELAD